MAIRVTFECGHASMLRVQRTQLGYTHDWEVFVRGVDNADISQYVDRVVFHLHHTFPNPTRSLKEPPYMVKESGYAGFVIPVDVYVKNKDEPKRIQIKYDLQLQKHGPAINNVIRHHEVFVNPSEEFRKKLLKGGGSVVPSPEDPADKGDSKMVPPMVSKPKLSGTDVKKHRMTDMRTSTSFVGVFGNPMTLPAKVSPENKRPQPDKVVSSKVPTDKPEKVEKPSKVKHSPHKGKKKDKIVEEKKEKKDRSVVKDKDRVKESKSKRPPSPGNKEELSYSAVKKTSTLSPPKKQLVPPVTPGIQKPPSPKPKEKEHKKMYIDKEKDKVKDNFKVPIEDRKLDRKKKKHKEEKSKDRKEKDKEKEHEKMKESLKKAEKKIPKPEKAEKTEKEKSLVECKVPKDGKKSPKYTKDKDKVRIDKTERSDTIEKVKDSRTDKEKQKHKHKRREKKDRLDESLEKEKLEKVKISGDKRSSYTTLPSSNPLSTLLAEMPERDSSDSTHSVDEDSIPLTKTFSTPKNDSEVEMTPVLSSETSKPLSPRGTIDSKNENEERSRKEKTKVGRSEERDCRKRKRKDGGPNEHSAKRSKERRRSESPSLEPVSSSQSPISIDIDSTYNFKETTSANNEINNAAEIEQVTPDSTNNAFVESETDGTLVFSEDYVSQLKELQQKIMTLQDNQELQRVVQVIAETGQYEITRKTFDFDLCALDRRTVQRLQQFFSTS